MLVLAYIRITLNNNDNYFATTEERQAIYPYTISNLRDEQSKTSVPQNRLTPEFFSWSLESRKKLLNVIYRFGFSLAMDNYFLYINKLWRIPH